MFDKNVPMLLIQLESALRSRSFYVEHVELESAETKASKPDCNCEDEHHCSQPKHSLTHLEKLILVHLVSRPIPVLTQQEIVKSFAIKSGSVLNRSQRRLLARKLITLYRIQKSKQYLVLWIATDKGFEAVGSARPTRSIIGGDVHAFIVDSVRKHFKAKGWKTESEFKLEDGSLVDTVIMQEKEVWCIEVGLPPIDKEVSNAKKIVFSSLNPNKVLHLVSNGKDKMKLEDLLRKDDQLLPHLEKIQVELAGDYL